MTRDCAFDELPEALRERISRERSILRKNGNTGLVRCSIEDQNYAECIVKCGDLIGVYRKQYDNVTCFWFTRSDIEFMRNVIHESTRP
ncbi:MAG: hypothetical protein ACYDEJ_03140 [Desulfitobacteriaceae bacterium]